MDGQTLTDEHRAELDRLAAEGSSHVDGIYRAQPWTARLSLIILPGIAAWTVHDAHDATSWVELDIVFVVLCLAATLHVAWIVWRDERYGILEEGVARVGRTFSGFVTWDRVERLERPQWKIGFYSRSQLVLEDGTKLTMRALPRWLERLDARVDAL